MSDARDLVLEHALRELYAGGPARDLGAAVREALERGERGSLTAEEVRRCEAAEEELVPLPSAPRSGVPVLALAAAALLVLASAALLWFVATRGEQREPPPSVAVPEKQDPRPRQGVSPAEGLATAADASETELDSQAPASVEEAWRFEQLVATVLGDVEDVKVAPGLPRPMPNMVGRYRDLARVSSELSLLLERRPGWWQEVEATLRRGASLDAKKVMMALDFLHRDPSERSLALARELWLERPEAFQEIHIVGFAERGAFEFAREVEAMVAGFEPGSGPPPVIAAAHLAFRGDKSGFEILEAGLEALKPGDLDRYLLAACALDASGDPTAWPRATRAVRAEVEQRLLGNELLLASEVALGLEFYALEREALPGSRLDLLELRALEHVDRRRNEVQSESEIRAVLEALPR